MKTLYAFGLCLLTLALLGYGEATNAFEPPKDLQWGMPYDSVKSKLKRIDDIQLKDLNQENPGKGYKEYPELQLPSEFYRAEAKKLKLLDKKVQRTYLIFDPLKNLSGFHYILKWDNNPKDYKGYRKCWVYFSDLKQILLSKYGEPTLDETAETIRGENMPSGQKYTTMWQDSSGSSISLEITRQTHNAIISTIDAFLIFVIYSSPGIDAYREIEMTTGDEL